MRITIESQATFPLHFSDVASTVETFIRTIDGDFNTPDYEYRYVGDLFIEDHISASTTEEGDGLGWQEEDEESNDNERPTACGWCPVILCLEYYPEEQEIHVDRILVILKKNIPADLHIGGGLSGSPGNGIAYVTGKEEPCKKIKDAFDELEKSGNFLHDEDEEPDAETQARFQAGLEKLQPYQMIDRVKKEGWCCLRSDIESDYPFFVFFNHSWSNIHPIESTNGEIFGAVVMLENDR